jgi:hypothetical protein
MMLLSLVRYICTNSASTNVLFEYRVSKLRTCPKEDRRELQVDELKEANIDS